MAITLTNESLELAAPFGHAPGGEVRIEADVAGTYVTGGIPAILAELQAAAADAATPDWEGLNLGGLTIVSITGYVQNGTNFYPVRYSDTAALMLLDGSVELANGANLAGYTLEANVCYQ